MAAFCAKKMKLLTTRTNSNSSFLRKSLSPFQSSTSPYSRSHSSRSSTSPSSSSTTFQERERVGEGKEEEEDVIPTSGLGRPLSEILKELNKKVPDSLVRQRVEDGFSARYVPWHLVNRIMNLHAPEWSGEVRNITYSPDGKSVSVVYRVTLYGTDAEATGFKLEGKIFCSTTPRESTGTASVDGSGFGDPVQKAEAMAFRRACARFGLALHLYHEDTSE